MRGLRWVIRRGGRVVALVGVVLVVMLAGSTSPAMAAPVDPAAPVVQVELEPGQFTVAVLVGSLLVGVGAGRLVLGMRR